MEQACQTNMYEELDGSLDRDVPHIPGKFVSVVYHKVSYQSGAGAGYLDIDDNTGICKLVSAEDLPNQDVKVTDYLLVSLVALFVFLPYGLLAVHNSLRVHKAEDQKNGKDAKESSDWALQFTLLAFLLGPLIFMALFVLIFIPMHHV
ncbi:hypothetical protein MAR_007776 [Mya arenaria]|uniref:Uncharacterized protein n=1 Tax=Mya arenaria TaxID=6604 RepID=A0ABY7DU41_MYAAR|nr:uncharacterized protein LOC128229949 [Mya arenaria]WAR01218.1 hypothetical protein MAR_007776 [Mya arenaria]